MSVDDRGQPWWKAGKRPDYRFSLANERTFLAWIRTALALMAGATAIHQFAHNLGPWQLRLTLVLVLFAMGALLGGSAYRRWAKAERAMRHDQDLPLSLLLPLLSVFAVVLAAMLAALIYMADR